VPVAAIPRLSAFLGALVMRYSTQTPRHI